MTPPLYKPGDHVVRSTAAPGLRFPGKIREILTLDQAEDILRNNPHKNFYWKDFQNRDKSFINSPMYLVESLNVGFASFEEAASIVHGLTYEQYNFLDQLSRQQVEELYGIAPKIFLCLESDLLPAYCTL